MRRQGIAQNSRRSTKGLSENKIPFSEGGDFLVVANTTLSDYMVTHPHPNPPLEGEGIFSLLHLQGGGREGDGVRKRNAMLKRDKVELRSNPPL